MGRLSHLRLEELKATKIEVRRIKASLFCVVGAACEGVCASGDDGHDAQTMAMTHSAGLGALPPRSSSLFIRESPYEHQLPRVPC